MMAVGSKCGRRELFLSNKSNQAHSLFKKNDVSLEIGMITLEEILNKHNIMECDLLKINAEGAEYEILYSLPVDYFKRIKRIYLESHDLSSDDFIGKDERYNMESLIEFLKDKKYRVGRKSVYIYAEKTA